MRTPYTYSNKRVKSNASPRYESKALIHEIKAGLQPYQYMKFNEEYDALAHDPEQQEGFVEWYHTRLKNGYVDF